ncbi:uncharacterized protein [Thunnus thynnus]|uniref:uncharacterized protein n=1 Tax=Thunnus thynnus TaxID=8237 RepID=UPI003528E222
MNKRGKTMLQQDHWMPPTPKPFVSALAPFPRSTWIHPHVPNDQFDRVCKEIWRRTMKVKEKLDICQRSPERQQNKDCKTPHDKISHRAEEQQKETDALSLSTQCEENKQKYHTDFTLPCPYLSGRRHPHVAEPVRVLSPVMEEKIKPNKEATEGKRNLEKDAEEVPQSGSRSDKQSASPVLPFTAGTKLEPQPPASISPCPATEDPTSHLPNEEDPPALPSEQRTDTCASEDEQDTRSSSDSSSSDDEDFVTLPGLRSCATNSSGDDPVSDVSDSDMEENEILHSPDESSSDSRQDSPSSSSEEDFPALSSVKVGTLPQPTAAPASGKVQGQWEISFSFNPRVIPTDTLASGMTVPGQAPVQGKAEAHQAKLKTNATPAAPTQQEAYDLLADFPALQPPKKPLALCVLRNGNPNTKEGKRGLTHSQNHRQDTGASHQRKMENVPHEVSSICAGDQKSVLDLQTFGSASQHNSPTISCEVLKANNLPPPRVAGTDGVGVNARSWASAAKAGMKQAAAPQEKARPCTFQQIVTINRAKAVHSVAQNIPYRATPSHQAAPPLVNAWCRGPRPHNPNRFVRPGYPPTHQHFGAQVHRANCPPGLRCPRFPFQQARGNHSKCGYMRHQPL